MTSSPTLGPRQPQIIVTLSPSGLLQVELPGANGGRRKIELRSGEGERDLLRMLGAQLHAHYAIGEDGAPTEQQVQHWEQHGIWPSAKCPFCKAEGRASNGTSGSRKRQGLVAEYGGVEVRRIEPKARGNGPQRAKKSAEELGL